MPGGRKGRGGYQRPASPAAVSGPGALSGRTDGGPADRQPIRPVPAAAHGDRQQLVALQEAAPMQVGGPAPPALAPAPPGMAPGPAPGPVDVFGPSQRPEESVLAGAATDLAPGAPDPDMLLLAPHLPALEFMASQPGASPSSRQFVRRLRAAVDPALIQR